MIGNFAATLALKELSSALVALDAPHGTLPDVKNKDGESIQEVKEKRLALVRQHVQAAGDIINLQEQVNSQAQMAIQATLAKKYKGLISDTLREQGIPNELLAALDGLPGVDDTCECPSCVERRNGEPARKFGFGRVTENQQA